MTIKTQLKPTIKTDKQKIDNNKEAKHGKRSIRRKSRQSYR